MPHITVPVMPRLSRLNDQEVAHVCANLTADSMLMRRLPNALTRGLTAQGRNKQENAVRGVFFWRLEEARQQALEHPDARSILRQDYLLLERPVDKTSDWEGEVIPLLDAVRSVAHGRRSHTPQRRSNVHVGRGYVGNSCSKAANRGRGRASGAQKRGVKGK